MTQVEWSCRRLLVKAGLQLLKAGKIVVGLSLRDLDRYDRRRLVSSAAGQRMERHAGCRLRGGGSSGSSSRHARWRGVGGRRSHAKGWQAGGRKREEGLKDSARVDLRGGAAAAAAACFATTIYEGVRRLAGASSS